MGSDLHRPRVERPELIVRPSVGEDVHEMASRLRTEDQAEIVACSGRPPVEALGQGFACSVPCMTVEYMGRASTMFGVVPSETTFPRLGAVWLLGTDDINLFSRQFLRQSRSWLKEVCKDYDIVGNVVDERNDQHVRWLRWMGFKFIHRHESFGRLGLPFLEFTIITSSINV